MSVAETQSSQPLSNLRAFALHLWAFVLPLITLCFWLTGPHAFWASFLWLAPIVVLVYIDNHAPPDHRQPLPDIPSWPYRLQVYALFAIQIANYALCVRVASRLHVDTLEGVVQTVAMLVPTMVLTGTTAGYSGIVTAHELIHRRNPIEFTMGRILLVGVLYEHFATEHVRGHHPRVGTLEDPATARFGETFVQFFWRTLPAQFVSAWKLEKVRLGDPNLPWYSPRMLQHRVLQGVVAEITLLACIGHYAGFIAFMFYFFQARTAVYLLETVNYVEHWGLLRAGKKVASVDSWDTDNWFTLYTLIGLSRHADHHAQASRPYQKLRYFSESAKMPFGYYGTILTALFRNARYRELATAELQQKGLGPFRSEASARVPTHRHPLRAPAQELAS